MIKSSNIPMPEKQLKNCREKECYLFVHDMKVGDSVTFLLSDLKWRTKYETVVKKMKRKGWTPIRRKQDGKMIVWRFD
jgi:hypothetical protein